jgi:hypothetical protein
LIFDGDPELLKKGMNSGILLDVQESIFRQFEVNGSDGFEYVLEQKKKIELL